MISATPQVMTVPLKTDEHGVIRVGGTRVTLETVIHAFNRGDVPEQIIYSYPVLKLADVYAVIAYYLQHQDEVDAYVRLAEAEAEQARQEIEARHPDMVNIRQRILARLEAKKREPK